MLTDSATRDRRLQPDRHDHLHAAQHRTAPPARWTPRRHGQRRRHLQRAGYGAGHGRCGTYTWDASYSGDSLTTAPAHDGTNESVTTVKASPTISTSGQRDGRRRGAARPVLSDSATADRRLQPDRHDHLHADSTGRHHRPVGHRDGTSAATAPTTRQLRCRPRRWAPTPGTPATAATANNAASDAGTNESVTTVKASPAISTTRQPDGRRRGGHVAVLSDSAT